MAMFLVMLTLNGFVASAPAPNQVEPPPPETVARLLVQLGADDFRSREEASARLEEFGGAVLPALRKALASSTELEVKRRIELVVTRIENALLKIEEKRWKDLNAPRHGIKDRLLKVLAKAPALSDQEMSSAIYLLTLGRTPTDDEVKRALQQFVVTSGRAASAVALARSLVQSNEFCAEPASVNLSLSKVRTELGAETDLTKILHRLNSDEFQKLTTDVAASLDKAVKTDAQLIDLAFLLTLSRFPKANEAEQAIAHLKKMGRLPGAADMVWALINTKEFIMPD